MHKEKSKKMIRKFLSKFFFGREERIKIAKKKFREISNSFFRAKEITSEIKTEELFARKREYTKKILSETKKTEEEIENLVSKSLHHILEMRDICTEIKIENYSNPTKNDYERASVCLLIHFAICSERKIELEKAAGFFIAELVDD